jgi:hypothetical protein
MNLYWMRRRAAAAPVSRVTLTVAIGLLIGLPATLLLCARVFALDEAESAFLKENELAMSRMMAGMTIKPSGDVDRDFVSAMIPHHQGAIEMAQALLRHGRNEQLRRIAQEIIVDQTQEIAAMRLALGERAPDPAAVPTEPRQ